ncbi:zincin [Anaeromyces robustus]|uniref:Zincin n=1 Tax=Anaeromyces robustus TaxID=1754192 RepID=A0A1Y1X1H9_9FUNG|nr:zincin [Anaeromyces robustus]|eukprot:ORX79660.1 zincin [Anaeromyces robustus]
MDMALGKIFVEKYYSDEIKKDIEEKIINFEETMIQRISQISWIDKQTKNYAIQKVSKIKNKIGYPDYIKNPKNLYEKYEKLEVNDKDFYINSINYWKYIMLEDLKSIKYPLNKDDWRNPPQTLNAFNEIYSNYMVYPAGILQPLFYKTNEPDYLIYSTIGAIIGHEITHAFDNTGRLYDEEGNINNWWTYSTAKEYDNLTQCFIDQYNNYYIEDLNGNKYYVNGLATLGENIADNGGFTRSFEAWKKSMTKNSTNNKNIENRNFKLPGLSDYTFDQLFFIAFGQFFCKKEDLNISIRNISRDVHSPSKFRVNGYVSNSDYFAEIFHCPVGLSMNPNKKCLIW